MATFQVKTPENFHLKNPEEFDKWITRFERFKIASGLNGKSEEQQVNTLLYCMGREAGDIFHSFHLSNAQQKQLKSVTDNFKNYFVVRRNVIFERSKFNMRKQEEGESVDTFMTALYTLPEMQLWTTIGWLVGCFGFNGPLRRYFSLYQAVSQREGERGEK